MINLAHKIELDPTVAQAKCADCGAEHDRDVNAAKNLKMLAESSSVTACGAAVSPSRKTRQAVMKQEPNRLELAQC